MRYSSYIDNISAHEWGLNIQQAYLFEWLYSLPSWATPASIDGKEYFFASKTKAIEELPLLTEKVDTMYRYYKQLEEKGLIYLKKVDAKDYVALTDKGKLWGRSSDDSEKNPSVFGKKSGKRAEKNPTYKTTTPDKITSDLFASSEADIPEVEFNNIPNQDIRISPKKTRAVKADKEAPPAEYTEFVRLWAEKYPTILKFPRDGKMVRELIAETRRQLEGRHVEPSPENCIEFWGIFVANLHRTWAHNKILPVVNQHYPSLIKELEDGKQQWQKRSITDQATDFLNRL